MNAVKICEDVRKRLIDEDEKYYFKPWSRTPGDKPPIITSAKGCYLWDSKGNRYLDFTSELVNVNIGHGHPSVIKAIKQQLDDLQYIMPKFLVTSRIKLAKKLAEITPGNLSKSFFTCGGSEAVESAIKIAKEYTTRFKVISLWGGYHGSTYGAMSVTGITRNRTPFEPLVPGFLRVPAPYCYRCYFNLKYPNCDMQCARFVESVIKQEDATTIAAFIAEPVLGSGCIVPPREYWPMIRELCDRYNIVLINDEIMTGFGRTGKIFAHEHYNMVPDMLVLGKGITSGYLPLGTVVVDKKISESFTEKTVTHGFTYSGHPVCCVAAIAAIKVYFQENLVENAGLVGSKLGKRLKEVEASHKCVGETRGLGLMHAIELTRNKLTKELLATSIKQEEIAYLYNEALKKGLLVGLSSFAPNTIRLCPPLCITEEEVSWSMNILDEVLAGLDKKLEGAIRHTRMYAPM